MASAMPASEDAGLLTDGDNDQMDICNEASVPTGVPTGGYSNQMDVCATSSPRGGDQTGGYSSQMDISTTPSPIRRQTAVYKSINPSPYQPPPRFDAGQLSGQPFGRQTSKPRLPPWLARRQASGQPPFGRRVVPAAPPPRTNSVPKESDPFLPPPDQKRLLIDRSRSDYCRNNLFRGRSNVVQTSLRGSYGAPQVSWSPHVPHIPQTPQVPRKRPLPNEADDYATENLPSKKAMQQHVPGAWPNTPVHGNIFMEDADASSKGQTALTSSTAPPTPTTHAQQSPPRSPFGSPLSGVYPHSHQSGMAEAPIPQGEAVGTAQDGGYFNLRNWASWFETIRRVYAAPRGMQRTVQTVMRAAVNLAGSFKRQAVGIIERTREHIPRRRHTAPSSPTRASLRLFPEEQRRRMRDHRWRRDRGYPTVDNYPFPELNFDFLQSPPSSPSNADLEATPTHHVTSNMELETTSTLPSFPPINPPSGTAGEATERPLSTLPLASPSDGTSHATTENRPFRSPVPFDPAAESNDSMIDERPSIPTEENESLRDFLIRINSGSPAAAPSADEPTPAAPTMLTSNPLPSAAETRDVLGHVSPNKRQKDRPTFAPPLAPWIRPATPVEEEDVIPEMQPAVEEDKENEPPVPPEISDEELLSPDHFREEQESFLFGPAVSAVNLVRPNPLPIPPGRTDSVFAREWKKIEKERVSKERSERKTRTRIEGPAVHRLTTEWERRVTDAMRLPNSRKIASTLSGDPLTRRDLASCYTQGTWLNDEVINAYLAILIDYLRRSNNNAGRHDKPLFHAFNTFFFSNLRDRGYQAVRRWANRAKIGGKDLLNVDTIFVPVHNQAHWTLIVVRPSARTIENFDSLGSVSKRHVDIIKSWLEGELGADFDEGEWEVLASRSPQQTNGSDCGAFLLSTAKAVAVGIDPLSYGAADIPLLRLKVVAEVVNGGLEGDFEPLEGGL